MQYILQNVKKESERKSIKHHLHEDRMHDCKQWDIPTCNLQFGDTEIELVQQLYLGIVLTEDGKGHEKRRRRISAAKEKTFQKLSKVLGSRKISSEIKKKVLNCYTVSDRLYGSKC